VDYATRTKKGETLVWAIRGKEHDQDEAVIREVKRFPLSFPSPFLFLSLSLFLYLYLSSSLPPLSM